MSQKKFILRDLKAGMHLTQLEAYRRYGCTRLAARIADLKDSGYLIDKVWVERERKRFAKYYLVKS